MKKRICVIGNAKLKTDSSHIEDTSDMVMRINDCKNYDGLSGQKTDAVLVNNIGGSAESYVTGMPFKNNQICSKAKTFIIVRDYEVHREFRLSTKQEFTVNFRDHKEEIVSSNGIPADKLEIFSKDFNVFVFNALLKMREGLPVQEPFLMPSTGMFAILYAVKLREIFELEAIMLGFKFQGWGGHPWSLEKRLCAGLIRSGKIRLQEA